MIHEKTIDWSYALHNTDNNDIQMRPSIKALTAVGAIPVVLPLTSSEDDLRQLVDTLDGFLFTGGPTFTFLFGENFEPLRQRFRREDQDGTALLPLVMETGKPVLGICRGIQLLNIGLGGTIWQDIPSQVKRVISRWPTQPFAYAPSHTVTLQPEAFWPGSRKRRHCPSTHASPGSQRCGPPVSSPRPVPSDQLVEAVEMPDYPFFIGVQWHPGVSMGEK